MSDGNIQQWIRSRQSAGLHRLSTREVLFVRRWRWTDRGLRGRVLLWRWRPTCTTICSTTRYVTVFAVISAPVLISVPPHISQLIDLIFLIMPLFKASFYKYATSTSRPFFWCIIWPFSIIGKFVSVWFVVFRLLFPWGWSIDSLSGLLFLGYYSPECGI